jgi:hypothetical protein
VRITEKSSSFSSVVAQMKSLGIRKFDAVSPAPQPFTCNRHRVSTHAQHTTHSTTHNTQHLFFGDFAVGGHADQEDADEVLLQLVDGMDLPEVPSPHLWWCTS